MMYAISSVVSRSSSPCSRGRRSARPTATARKRGWFSRQNATWSPGCRPAARNRWAQLVGLGVELRVGDDLARAAHDHGGLVGRGGGVGPGEHGGNVAAGTRGGVAEDADRPRFAELVQRPEAERAARRGAAPRRRARPSRPRRRRPSWPGSTTLAGAWPRPTRRRGRAPPVRRPRVRRRPRRLLRRPQLAPPDVLDRRLGIPITLSVLAMEVGRRVRRPARRRRHARALPRAAGRRPGPVPRPVRRRAASSTATAAGAVFARPARRRRAVGRRASSRRSAPHADRRRGCSPTWQGAYRRGGRPRRPRAGSCACGSALPGVTARRAARARRRCSAALGRFDEGAERAARPSADGRADQAAAGRGSRARLN